MQLARSLISSLRFGGFPLAAASQFSDISKSEPLKIILLESPEDPANEPLRKSPNLNILHSFTSRSSISDLSSIEKDSLADATAIFCSNTLEEDSQLISDVLTSLPAVSASVKWIHARSAGVEHLLTHDFMSTSPSPNLPLINHKSILTNARGSFSSTLAEYCMGAVFYFEKDLPRLFKNKTDKNYDRFHVGEIKGKKLGIVGYGDIGRACGRLARFGYGMEVSALKRTKTLADGDAKILENGTVYSNSQADVNKLMANSDYVLVAAPLTPQTRNLINEEALSHAKSNCVLINLGRGPIVDEAALIKALQSGQLKGAALDVFDVEPLPPSNPLWSLPNVFLSPHNMDMTKTFTIEASEDFVDRILPIWQTKGNQIDTNLVDKSRGY
ncbi:hypothetical protein ScalyP_jg9074 [Parmales sp. scaly parma]|nr:hypothetical protein ScalyP_jg9074 [Parmales sp. scaly parma]